MASTIEIPKTQTAWRVTKMGEPKDVLKRMSDTPVLSDLKDGDVLVKIKSAGMNAVGYRFMRMIPNFIAPRPATAEIEFSGVVVAQKGTSFEIGNPVFGQIGGVLHPSKQGALAQYISVEAQQLCHKPASLSWDEAAGTATAGRTAIDALVDIAKVQPGQHVFINGGSSGVGSIAIQIAKARGAKVTTSCSARNNELVKRLGADEVVDYRESPPHERFVKSPPTPLFDVVFDVVATDGRLFRRSPAYLKKDGIFVTTMPGSFGGFLSLRNFPGQFVDAVRNVFQPVWLGGTPRKHYQCWDQDDGRAMPTLQKLVDENGIKPVIDSVYKFDDVFSAYDRSMSGRAVGKIIVRVDENDA